MGDLASELERLRHALRFGAMDRRTPVNPDGRAWSDWDRWVGNDRRFYAAQQRAELQARVAQLERQISEERATLERNTIAARQQLEREAAAREAAAAAAAARRRRPPPRQGPWGALARPALAPAAPSVAAPSVAAAEAREAYALAKLAMFSPEEMEAFAAFASTASPAELAEVFAGLFVPPPGWRPGAAVSGIPDEVRAVDDVISSIWGAVRDVVPYGNLIDQAHRARRGLMYGPEAAPARPAAPKLPGARPSASALAAARGGKGDASFRYEARRLQDLTRRAAKGDLAAKGELVSLRASARSSTPARRTWNAAAAVLRDDLSRIRGTR